MVNKFSRRVLLGGVVAAGAVSAAGSAVAFASGSDEAEARGNIALPLLGPVDGNRLHVMSFNVRVGVDGGARSWEARLPRIEKVVKAERPTILGTQEGRPHQIRDLKERLPGYGWAWRGREKNGSGETCAIFYRKDRLEKLDEGHRWLSKTPTVPGSISWGAKFPRMMTWIRFRDLRTKQVFVHVNTHFDHSSALAREKSAHLVREWMRGRDESGLVTGDFNTGAGTAPHRTMIDGGFHDAWNHKAARVTPTYGTANGWRPRPKLNGRRIDWIIATSRFDVHKTGINTWVTRHDNLPSDHWAVQAVVSLR